MFDYEDYWQPDGRIIRFPKLIIKKAQKPKDYFQPDGSVVRF